MKSLIRAAVAAALLSIVVLAAAPALAQRVFVAAQGADANPCTFALPCRTFQHAHNVVAAGGEIDVLDPAGYGALTINKPISIQGHGFSGVSVGSGGTGITVNAGASDAVSLNGLLIEGSGVGGNGIVFNSGKSLVVEHCVARNMVNDGLHFLSSAATAQSLSVSDSYFTDNGGSGIEIETQSSGAITAAIARVGIYGSSLFVNGAIGFPGATGPTHVAVTDSVVSNGGGVGVVTNNSAWTQVLLTRVTSSGNGVGISALGVNGSIFLAQSTVTGNTMGYSAISGAGIVSYGDNIIDGNGSNNGVLGSASMQ
jgi:hypothetical protein